MLESRKLEVVIYSLNCFGAENNKRLIKWLLTKADVVFLSETWCTNKFSLMEKLEMNEEYFKILHKAPSKDNDDDYVHSKNKAHKPPAGIAWFMKKEMECKIKCEFISSRLSYIILNDSLVIFGVYLPSNNTKSSINSQIMMLKNLSILIDKIKQFENRNYKIIIIGDINMDHIRQNTYDKNLLKLMKNQKLISHADLYEQEIDFTFFKGRKRSLIDHVLASENLMEINDVEIIHTVNKCTQSLRKTPFNHGDHHPIKMVLSIDTNEVEKIETSEPVKRLVWTAVNKIKYDENIYLKNKLVDTRIDLLDKNNHSIMEYKCYELINKLYCNMRECSNEFTEEMMVKKGFKLNDNADDRELDELKIKMKVAKKIWQEDGGLVNLEKWEKIQKAVKKFKKFIQEKKEYNKVNMLNKAYRNYTNKYWKKLDKLHKPKVQTNVDVDQARQMMFDLFNQPFLKSDDSQEMELKRQEFINEFKDTVFNYVIDEQMINKILKSLNTGCSIGFSGISNELFKYGNNQETRRIIKTILELYINYNIRPMFFNMGIIKLIVKDENKNHDDTNNLRPITISDTITIIYEKIMILLINNCMEPKQEQFGFKSNSSCAHAIFTVRELALSAKRKKKHMIICALDASKAFDKVNRSRLFSLLKGKLSNELLRSLINYYDQLTLTVQINKSYSKVFKTKYGVKQGGPMSPRLFAVYVEPLTDMLKSVTIGVKFGNLTINHVLYADDTSLLCNTVSELNTLLKIVHEFGKKFEIKFNPDKTQYIMFENSANKEYLKPTFDNIQLEKVENIKFLGAYLTTKLSSKLHVNTKVNSAIFKINTLNKSGFNSKYASYKTKMVQYKMFIRPLLLHDAENQFFNKGLYDLIQTTESSLIKKSYGLCPLLTRSTDLNRAHTLDSIRSRIFKIKANFFLRLLKNNFTLQIVNELLNDKGATESKQSLVGYLMNELNHYDTDISWIVMKIKDRVKLNNIEYDEECNTFGCLITQEILMLNGAKRRHQLNRQLRIKEHIVS